MSIATRAQLTIDNLDWILFLEWLSFDQLSGGSHGVTVAQSGQISVLPTGDSFNKTLGATLCVVPGAAGQMEAAYSNVAGELVGALFTTDPQPCSTRPQS